jgi:hypothetical protein
MRGLRVFLVLDAAILFWLGAAFIAAPQAVAKMFGFLEMPPGVNYILGMWGCVLVTMAGGYAVTAANPIRNIAWIHVGIARGILEAITGAVCAIRGVVTWNQAAFGIAAGTILALAYTVLYPKQIPEPAPAGAAEDG